MKVKLKNKNINVLHLSLNKEYEVVILEIKIFDNSYSPLVYLCDDLNSLIICDLNFFEISEHKFSEDFIIKSDEYFLTLIPESLSYESFLDDLHSDDNYIEAKKKLSEFLNKHC